MREHYSINRAEFRKLRETVSTAEMIECVPKFTYNMSPPGKVAIMCYIDKHGPIFDGESVDKKIARAIFNSMVSDEKVEIMQYMETEDE